MAWTVKPMIMLMLTAACRAVILSVSKSKPYVFFLGLQKSGTTSFTYFMQEVMNAKTFHGSDLFYRRIEFDNQGQHSNACDQSGVGPGPPKWEPDYASVLRELNSTKVQDYMAYLDTLNFEAFADMPFPSLFQYLDERYPDSKFVFWARDSSDWVRSVKSFFGRDPRRMMTLNYGACTVHDLEDSQLKRAYEGHTSAVREYFAGSDTPPARKSRFLEFDLTGPTAARDVCEFLNSGVTCDGLGAFPKKNVHQSSTAPSVQRSVANALFT
eukprot:gnl/TRDRNA2_/TRDRNA2_153071_c0_seq2.p1 gnl/TRDRNA2_/TRDRNA2_153071_c0~~gnl/TRDRNA2_/TRDRNA2_153071_c0_seq2.p1  ORF type:complete len:269 (+),score=16.51 gnl/TRDRNA2_/TRDRNA2_153071_c0_seq2:3-809(+)